MKNDESTIEAFLEQVERIRDLTYPLHTDEGIHPGMIDELREAGDLLENVLHEMKQ